MTMDPVLRMRRERGSLLLLALLSAWVVGLAGWAFTAMELRAVRDACLIPRGTSLSAAERRLEDAHLTTRDLGSSMGVPDSVIRTRRGTFIWRSCQIDFDARGRVTTTYYRRGFTWALWPGRAIERRVADLLFPPAF